MQQPACVAAFGVRSRGQAADDALCAEADEARLALARTRTHATRVRAHNTVAHAQHSRTHMMLGSTKMDTELTTLPRRPRNIVKSVTTVAIRHDRAISPTRSAMRRNSSCCLLLFLFWCCCWLLLLLLLCY